MTQKVAIQGYEGSFHQAAAREYFGPQTEILPCASFRELVKQTVRRRECGAGLMAIENSIAGSILPNYNLLHKNPLRITGEIFLHIRQHLLANKGVKLEDIREVHSHPMALLQCTEYLDRHAWKLVETEDTALSARLISRRHNRHSAAIAGKLAAEMFDLQILAPNIHTQKHNYTRFLVIRHEKEEIKSEARYNKASLYFETDHSRGSLARALNSIAAAGINLSKLQSFPIPGNTWNYSFYADLEFDNTGQYRDVMKDLPGATRELKVLGTYLKGATY